VDDTVLRNPLKDVLWSLACCFTAPRTAASRTFAPPLLRFTGLASRPQILGGFPFREVPDRLPRFGGLRCRAESGRPEVVEGLS